MATLDAPEAVKGAVFLLDRAICVSILDHTFIIVKTAVILADAYNAHVLSD
jgi:hypothetical protein